MKYPGPILCLVLLAGLVPLGSSADEAPAVAAPPPASAASAVPAAQEAPATPSASAAPHLVARELPRLVMSWDCGACTQNEKVLPLIEQEYAKQALAKGYTVSDSETAELRITEFRQRPPGMRVMFGVFAGKDVLKTVVRFRDRSFEAGDYMANAWHGMNSLCESVAQRAIQQILPSLGSP